MRYFSNCILTAVLGLLPASVVWCQSPSDIFRVEEDWELIVGEPDSQIDAPQISTSMSPTNDLSGLHFAFDLNHASHPSFVAGGFQTRALQGDSLLTTRTSETRSKLTTQNEVVRWTQVLLIWNQHLIFGVINGQSQSLGSFGGDNTVIDGGVTSLSKLNTYNPSVSKEWSGVGYAANRVSSMKLSRARLYTINGDVTTIQLNLQIE